MSKTKNNKSRASKNICDLLLFLVILVLLNFFYTCPFRLILGISCPGCGMTRALHSMLRLDFSGAFHYHPLFWTIPLIFIYLFAKYITSLLFKRKNNTSEHSSYVSFQSRCRKFEKYAVIFLCLLYIITYIIRILCKSEVLVFDFTQSLIYRIFNRLFF